jgi:hypothetical protein
VIETPLTFFEVEKEAVFADTAQLEEAELGVAPEGLEAIDVIFATGELVFVVIDAVVFVALEHEAVVSLPAMGIQITCHFLQSLNVSTVSRTIAKKGE